MTDFLLKELSGRHFLPDSLKCLPQSELHLRLNINRPVSAHHLALSYPVGSREERMNLHESVMHASKTEIQTSTQVKPRRKEHMFWYERVSKAKH